jgi:hypothetical protein
MSYKRLFNPKVLVDEANAGHRQAAGAGATAAVMIRDARRTQIPNVLGRC